MTGWRAAGAPRQARQQARLGFVVAGLLGLCVAGCSTAPQGPVAATVVRGPTVAFESIDGPPEQLFRKLVNQLGEEATAHRVAMVSREQPAQYRIRGYVAAHVQGKRTTITWIWDVFNSDRERAVRLGGEVPGAPSDRAWAAAVDAVVARIARDGMSRLAAFLASPGSPGEFLPPREEASSVASTTDTEASLAFLPPLRP